MTTTALSDALGQYLGSDQQAVAIDGQQHGQCRYSWLQDTRIRF